MEIAYIILLREFALIPESDKALHIVLLPGGSSDKDCACQCRRCRRLDSAPDWEDGHGSLLRYSCLESPVDRGT